MVKVAKPQQDMRYDVPTVGMKTVENIASSGGRVLAIEAGRTILLDGPEVIDFADRHGLVIVAIDDEAVAKPADPHYGRSDLSVRYPGDGYCSVASPFQANSPGSHVVLEIEARLPQGILDLLLVGRILARVNDAPEDRAAALDVNARGDLLDHQVGIQPRHEVLHGIELVLVAHGKRFGQLNFGQHDSFSL